MEIKISDFQLLTNGISSNSILPIVQNGINYSISISSLLFPLSPIVTQLSAINNQNIISKSVVDETLYITPNVALSAATWTLPSSSNCRVGQIKTFISSKAITTLTVSGDTIGNSLTTALANEAYSYQCISSNGKFLRLA